MFGRIKVPVDRPQSPFHPTRLVSFHSEYFVVWMKQRVLPLNNSARKSLKAWFDVRPETDLQNVFISQRGAIKARAVQSILEDLGKSARISKMTPHMARHTFAKNLVNSGVSLEKVAMLLGHTSLDTTMVYTTPGFSDLDQAVRVLDL
jgi:integrase/recombinase XerC